MSNATLRERHRRAMDGAPDKVKPRSRRWRLIPVAAGLAVAVLVAMTGKLFIWPTPTAKPPHRADAVIVLSGGGADRLNRAVVLMTQNVARTLVIFNGYDTHWKEASTLCNSPPTAYEVVCPTPKPKTTRGEAETARSLYRVRDWKLVVVVTSRYQLTRARLDMDRCLGSGFVMSSSNHPDGLLSKANHVVHEWAGWLKDQTIQRSC